MQKPELLDEVRNVARHKHLSRGTEKANVNFIRRFTLYHHKRHPREMGSEGVRAYRSFLEVNQKVAASTQNAAFSALLFLYRDVSKKELPRLEGVERACRPARLPVVSTRDEVKAILPHRHGAPCLIVSLLYGSGLRLLGALRLRVKGVDFAARRLTVRSGKGEKERVTMSQLVRTRSIGKRNRRAAWPPPRWYHTARRFVRERGWSVSTARAAAPRSAGAPRPARGSPARSPSDRPSARLRLSPSCSSVLSPRFDRSGNDDCPRRFKHAPARGRCDAGRTAARR